MGKPVGVIKLIGIAGFVEGDEHTLKPGEKLTIGRSRSCDISLRNSPKYLKIDPLQTQVDENFKTVSRTHVELEFKAADALQIVDHSSNGTFVDGKRLTGSCILSNLPTKSHELKLGTNEAYRVEFRKLVKRTRIEIVKVKDGEEPPEGAVPYDPDEDVEDVEDAGGEIEEVDVEAANVDADDEIEELDDPDEISLADDDDEPPPPLSDQVMESYKASHSKGPAAGDIGGKRPGKAGAKGPATGAGGGAAAKKSGGRLDRRLGRRGMKK
ncbi:MAG: FHA domain-containing protein [Planctomycetota bacterium]